MLTKKECLEALNDIENDLCELEEYRKGVAVYCLYNESLDKLNQVIHEHFDNRPLKFEELCNLIQNDRHYCFIPIWDNKFKCWRLLRNALHTQEGLNLIFQECKNVYFKYEENRFYRKQVMEE